MLKSEDNIIRIIYDGECPFCNNYVKLIRLRENITGKVELINAREDDALRKAYKEAGRDLNDGMAVEYKGKTYYGSDAVHLLGLLSSSDNWFSSINSFVFKSATRSKLLYPVLKTGRRIVLKIMGRQPL